MILMIEKRKYLDISDSESIVDSAQTLIPLGAQKQLGVFQAEHVVFADQLETRTD